jgi:hypothetical protein
MGFLEPSVLDIANLLYSRQSFLRHSRKLDAQVPDRNRARILHNTMSGAFLVETIFPGKYVKRIEAIFSNELEFGHM